MLGIYEIKDNDRIIAKGKNTVTKIGRRLIGDMITSSRHVDGITISAQDNNGTDTNVLASDYQTMPITNSYSIVDSVLNKLTIVFESYGGNPTINTIKSIGLSTVNGNLDTMVTISNQNDTDISTLTNIYMSYKLIIDI